MVLEVHKGKQACFPVGGEQVYPISGPATGATDSSFIQFKGVFQDVTESLRQEGKQCRVRHAHRVWNVLRQPCPPTQKDLPNSKDESSYIKLENVLFIYTGGSKSLWLLKSLLWLQTNQGSHSLFGFIEGLVVSFWFVCFLSLSFFFLKNMV